MARPQCFQLKNQGIEFLHAVIFHSAKGHTDDATSFYVTSKSRKNKISRNGFNWIFIRKHSLKFIFFLIPLFQKLSALGCFSVLLYLTTNKQ